MKHKRIGILAVGLFLSVGGIFGENFAVAVTDDYTLTVQPVLSLETGSVAVEGNMDETIDSSISITVYTNYVSGVTVQMTTNKNTAETNATALTHSVVSDVIPTLTASTSYSNFPTNAWGYSLDDVTFYPVVPKDSSAPSSVLYTTNNSQTKTATIYFATKTDETKSSGKYSTEILFTAVMNSV